MRKILAVCCIFALVVGVTHAADEKLLSCGPGYVLVAKSKIDGINTAECQKLWCRDLENNKAMGTGNSASAGYVSTSGPVELCDAENNCVECFGDRKWCAGETPGAWNPEYGAYTRGGADSSAYVAQQKASCFAWRLEKPTCGTGESAVLQSGEWVCATAKGTNVAGREAAIRRTGTIRRVIR